MFGVRQSIRYGAKGDDSGYKGTRGDRDGRFDHCRYVPVVKRVIEDVVDDVLDVGLFPYVVTPIIAPARSDSGGPSLRNTKPSWATRKATTKVLKLLIIFKGEGGKA
jgi:hypothetical protein